MFHLYVVLTFSVVSFLASFSLLQCVLIERSLFSFYIQDSGDAAEDTDPSSQKELSSDSSDTDHNSQQEFPIDPFFQYEGKVEAVGDTIQPQHQSISSIKESKSMFNVNVDQKTFGGAVSESVSKSSRVNFIFSSQLLHSISFPSQG